jgi:hypothetical protein
MNTYVILALLAFTVMGCYGLTAEREPAKDDG